MDIFAYHTISPACVSNKFLNWVTYLCTFETTTFPHVVNFCHPSIIHFSNYS